MQCDCITEVSKNLAKNMTTQIGAAAQAECQNQALCIVGNSLESHLARLLGRLLSHHRHQLHNRKRRRIQIQHRAGLNLHIHL